jgi:hypothetical protein
MGHEEGVRLLETNPFRTRHDASCGLLLLSLLKSPMRAFETAPKRRNDGVLWHVTACGTLAKRHVEFARG